MTSNADLAQQLKRSLRRTQRDMTLMSKHIMPVGLWDLSQSRLEELHLDVDIFLALAQDDEPRTQQLLTESVRWGLAHLTDRAPWPADRHIQSRVLRDVGRAQPQDAESPLSLDDLPHDTWDLSLCKRVRCMSTSDLAVRT